MPNTTENTLRRRRRNNNNNNVTERSTATPATDNNGNTTQNNNSPQQQQQQQQQPQNAFRQLMFRFLIMYIMYQYYMKPKSDQQKTTTTNATQQNSVNSNTQMNTDNSTLKGVNDWLTKMGVMQTPQPSYYRKSLICHWPDEVNYDVRVILSLDEQLSFRDAVALPPSQTIWFLPSLTYSTNEHNYHSKNFSVDVPHKVSHENSSWFAHVFVTKGGIWNVASTQNVLDEAIKEHVLYAKHELVTWIDVNVKKEGKHLLGGGTDDDEKDEMDNSMSSSDSETESEDREIDEKETVSDTESNSDSTSQQCHASGTCDAKLDETSDDDEKDANVSTIRYDHVWKPTLPIVLIIGQGRIELSKLPPPAADRFIVSEAYNSFYPPMHVEDFWHVRESMNLMNETVSNIDIEFSFKPISLYKWSLYRQFDNVFQRQLDIGAMGHTQVDEMKRVFIETNPVLLTTTMFVSVAHSVLEGLAFKNDISHWRNIKTMEGVSVRSMIWKIVMELIVFLYLWDHDTSWMIVIGNGVGLVIEIWKLCKAVKFEKFGQGRLFGFIPWFKISDHESYSKKTKEYDEQAMKYMGYLVYPLVIGYALYSLKYDTHKSWYSWIVNSLVGAVYAFGFIMMFPQIFINYKLKSVAHIPMKAMMYKTLNTIIDDLFSFIIKMPWLHRLACFRDDIVFLILLYQRYLYPTDYSRVNEFGQAFDDAGQQKAEESNDNSNSDSNSHNNATTASTTTSTVLVNDNEDETSDVDNNVTSTTSDQNVTMKEDDRVIDEGEEQKDQVKKAENNEVTTTTTR